MKSQFEESEVNRKRNDPKNYKWGFFYFNPEDKRAIVPKRIPMLGWTMNFANLYTYLIILAFILFAILVNKL